MAPSEVADARSEYVKDFEYYLEHPELFPAARRGVVNSILMREFRQKFPADVIDWGRRFFPHYLTQPASRMHGALAAELQWLHHSRRSKRATIAPRAGAKTTWTSKIYTLFCICHQLEDYILLIGDSSEQSYQNLAAVKRELEENRALAAAYPSACGVGRRWNQSFIITRNNIKVEALGSRKKVRGRTHGPHRPGLIIIDDLENDDGVQSHTQRNKTLRWLNRALLPSGSEDCNVLFVGTALHPEDALQKIKVTPGWKTDSFRALITEPFRLDLWDEWRVKFRNMGSKVAEREADARAFYEAHRAEMDQGAELLWPERESLYALMCWREVHGEVAFQAEKQGNAAAAGATEFGNELFPASIWFEHWPELGLKVMALDPSKGSHERNDYSAYVWGGLAADGKVYVDADIERRDASQVVSAGVRLYRQFLPQLFGLETVMFLQLFEELFRLEAARQGILLPITPLHPNESKIVRIRQLTPYLTRGNLRFRAGSRGAEMLVDQLKWFPTAAHDDGPDALQMMVMLLGCLSGVSGGVGEMEVVRA